MPIGISATLVGPTTPQGVQIVVTGLTVGQEHKVVGSWAGGTWTVRAGTAVATATQVVLGDVAAPINVPITYTITEGISSATSAPVTVAFADQYVLQSLDGSRTTQFRWLDNEDPRQLRLRTAVFDVPGRPRPASRWDVPGGEDGQLLAATTGGQTAAMKALLVAGGPLLLRTDGAVRDLAAVEYVLPTSATRVLTGKGIGGGEQRRWALAFEVIDDPEPDTLVPLSDWDDFDAVYSGSTWTAFDAEWAGRSWDQFDREDWAIRA